jgi:hypothetical protein
MFTMVWPLGGGDKNTKKSISTKIEEKGAYGMTQNKKFQPCTKDSKRGKNWQETRDCGKKEDNGDFSSSDP